ncbi:MULTISPECIES: hypothetical protein [unclassified Lactococcus]|uniref:hypothetical protein n=1 Tax=unclassified Lactococcus TaxID=2643510 RepID=UPI0011CB129B|nr:MULTISPECIES: hypothetical protein [unclassified Lactococcus]MQW23829.1 hypothetical protein [Lactococcus sp. dk101]TXK37346.1 hypothetical protein FVP42_08960 [Lactococcus sp. dk310]TXK48658.1 hypothetical protein FVP43_08935 [Lactococcus sp. dk322]
MGYYKLKDKLNEGKIINFDFQNRICDMFDFQDKTWKPADININDYLMPYDYKFNMFDQLSEKESLEYIMRKLEEKTNGNC